MLLAKNADVVLLCMGLDEIKESEGLDRMDMKLAQNQLDLLAAVAAVNPNVVVLLSAGPRWRPRGSKTARRWSTAAWAVRPVRALWWTC